MTPPGTLGTGDVVLGVGGRLSFNRSDALGITTRLGARFNVPSSVLDPRLVKFGVNINF